MGREISHRRGLLQLHEPVEGRFLPLVGSSSDVWGELRPNEGPVGDARTELPSAYGLRIDHLLKPDANGLVANVDVEMLASAAAISETVRNGSSAVAS